MRKGPVKSNGLGIASFILSIISGIASVVVIVIAGMAAASGQVNPDAPGDENFFAVIGCAILLSLGLGFIALVLGIISVCLPGRSKIFGILGICFSGLLMLGIVLLMIIGSVGA